MTNAMPRGSVSVICVEAWTCSVGAMRRMSRTRPRSCTMTASTPHSRTLLHELGHRGEFIREDERVEGDEPPHVAGVQEPHDFRQFFGVKFAARRGR